MAMRTVKAWFHEYSLAHRNPINRKIHKVCVPLIYWSVFGVLWALPRIGPMNHTPGLNWATLVLVGTQVFYYRLGLTYFIEMLVFSMLSILVYVQFDLHNLPLGRVSAVVFVLAWIGQFIGHKLEKEKPAFFDDLTFLLIGPIFIINGFKLAISSQPKGDPKD